MASSFSSQNIQTPAIRLQYAGIEEIDDVMDVMERSFSQEYGESWNEQQCLSMLSMPSTKLIIATAPQKLSADPTESIYGFSIVRAIAGEQELLMIAVDPAYQNIGIGLAMLEFIIAEAKSNAVESIFLEVRANNPAKKLYSTLGFKKIGRRASYYTGNNREKFDAITFKKSLQKIIGSTNP